MGERLIGALIVVYLTVQVVVPVLMRRGEANRFAWEMFAIARSTPSFTLVTSAGREYDLRVSDLVAVPRVDVDYAELLPPHLCRITPEARAVIVHLEGSQTRWDCP